MNNLQHPTLIASNINQAGLGNRMRFTLSAQSLAQVTGRHFRYVWPTDTFGATLQDLWDFDPLLEMTEGESLEIAQAFPKVDEKAQLPADQPVWHYRSALPLRPLPGSISWPQRLRELTPAPPIQKRIVDTFNSHLAGSPYIGVMIRAHEKSHAKTLAHSPVEWYLQRMEEMAEANPGVKFFISCDVPEVQERVMSAIPASFGLADKGGYGTKEGVVSSIVDLYLLASSSYMLTPYWSSFPTLSWLLAAKRIPKEDSRSGRAQSDVLTLASPADPLVPYSRS